MHCLFLFLKKAPYLISYISWHEEGKGKGEKEEEIGRTYSLLQRGQDVAVQDLRLSSTFALFGSIWAGDAQGSLPVSQS